jgi:dinuclear metal center YbgI/SA1388 family protein
VVRVKQLITWLDEGAPFRYAASWDHCGLQVGDPEGEVKRVLVALDPSSRTLGEARERGCQCLVTHHPLIFRPLDALRRDRFPDSLVLLAARDGIHVIAAHTNLDAARIGTNEELARLLALDRTTALEAEANWMHESQYGGMGRVGELRQPTAARELARELGRILEIDVVRITGEPERVVHRVALCTGSGGGFLERVVALGVDAFITGDIKYHEAQRAVEAGLTLIDIGHFASERLVVRPLAAYLGRRCEEQQADVEVLVAGHEADPFVYLRGSSANPG